MTKLTQNKYNKERKEECIIVYLMSIGSNWIHQNPPKLMFVQRAVDELDY